MFSYCFLFVVRCSLRCCYVVSLFFFFFFFKQKTAYEMRISDWSSDVCSSDLVRLAWLWIHHAIPLAGWVAPFGDPGIKARSQQIGRASCRERVCQYV